MPPPLIVNGTSTFMFPPSGGNETGTFGNYCTAPSGGLTLGFWSNKNGNKLLTGNANGTGTTLSLPVVTLLNSGQLRNANGTLHTFTTSYSAFRTWLLGATATNMAYMLSAQLVALKLDVNFNFVDGGAYDVCSNMTVTDLITTASDQLCDGWEHDCWEPNPCRPGDAEELHRRHQQQRRGRARHPVSVQLPDSPGTVPVITEVKR